MSRINIGGDKEKKNLMILGGLLVAIAVVVMVLYNPFGGGGSDVEDSASPTPAPASGASAPEPSPGGGPGAAPGDAAAPAPSTPAAAGGITAASLVSLGDYRTDPFEQFVLPQPPPPPPPVPIPAPVEIMPPASGGYEVGLPPMGVGNKRDNILVSLPPITPRRVVTAPTAPRSFVLPGSGGSGSIFRAQNKRLSGVIIGDSVRALLEVKVGDKTTTRVVQPGDEVDGIRILRLERVVEAGQTVTRLVVRENNQEQYVELRPAPQQQQGGAEGLIPGGMPPM